MAFSLVSEHKSAQTSGQQLAAGCDSRLLRDKCIPSFRLRKKELQSAWERSLFFFKQKQKET